MNQSELVKIISNNTGFTEKSIHQVIEEMKKIIKENAKSGVTLQNFGKFYLKTNKETKRYDINTGRIIHIPEKCNIAFKER